MGNVLVPAPNPIRTEYASLRAAIQRERETYSDTRGVQGAEERVEGSLSAST